MTQLTLQQPGTLQPRHQHDHDAGDALQPDAAHLGAGAGAARAGAAEHQLHAAATPQHHGHGVRAAASFHAALADAGAPGRSRHRLQRLPRADAPEVSPGQPTGIVEQAAPICSRWITTRSSPRPGPVIADGGMRQQRGPDRLLDCHRRRHQPGMSWTDGAFHAQHRRRRARRLHDLPLPADGRRDQGRPGQDRRDHRHPLQDVARSSQLHVPELPDLPHRGAGAGDAAAAASTLWAGGAFHPAMRSVAADRRASTATPSRSRRRASRRRAASPTRSPAGRHEPTPRSG